MTRLSFITLKSLNYDFFTKVTQLSYITSKSLNYEYFTYKVTQLFIFLLESHPTNLNIFFVLITWKRQKYQVWYVTNSNNQKGRSRRIVN